MKQLKLFENPASENHASLRWKYKLCVITPTTSRKEIVIV